MKRESYRVEIAESGKQDVKDIKKYILDHFKYRELGENFSRKIKKAALELDTFPQGHGKAGFVYRGYEIHLKPADTYLLFYVIDEQKKKVTILRVMQDGMNWQFILQHWIQQNN